MTENLRLIIIFSKRAITKTWTINNQFYYSLKSSEVMHIRSVLTIMTSKSSSQNVNKIHLSKEFPTFLPGYFLNHMLFQKCHLDNHVWEHKNYCSEKWNTLRLLSILTVAGLKYSCIRKKSKYLSILSFMNKKA